MTSSTREKKLCSMTKSGADPVRGVHVIGMRTRPNPAFATALMSSGDAIGFPQAVSPSGTSKLLPRFQPSRTFLKSSADVCVNARGCFAVAGVPDCPVAAAFAGTHGGYAHAFAASERQAPRKDRRRIVGF